MIVRAILGGLLAAPFFTGCANLRDYGSDRGRDLLDVVDLKAGRSQGLGMKAEASLYLGSGVGFALLEDTVEWYGRRRFDAPIPDEGGKNGAFVHALFAGIDEYEGAGVLRLISGGSLGLGEFQPSASLFSVHALGLNLMALENPDDPPLIDRWRLGAELVLPFVHGGLYLNAGQLLDFLLGFGTIDLAADDDLTELEDSPRPE